jgi:hypothetical protein
MQRVKSSRWTMPAEVFCSGYQTNMAELKQNVWTSRSTLFPYEIKRMTHRRRSTQPCHITDNKNG